MRFARGYSFLLSLPSLAILMAACGGGSSDSSGKSSDPLENIDPQSVNVATAACPSGFEHPNICCTGGDANHPAACAAYLNSPFHACDSGWTTYPNGATCCSLSDPSNCTTCDSDGNCGGPSVPLPGGGGPGGEPGCHPPANKCPPGWNGESEDCATGGCWRYEPNPQPGAPNKVGYCKASPSGGGSSGGGTGGGPIGTPGGGGSGGGPIGSQDAGTVDSGGCGEPTPPANQCDFSACGPLPPMDPQACGCKPSEPCGGSATCTRDANGQCTWKTQCGPGGTVDGGGPTKPPTCNPTCPPGWDPAGPYTCCRTDPQNPNAGECFSRPSPPTRP